MIENTVFQIHLRQEETDLLESQSYYFLHLKKQSFQNFMSRIY